MSTNNSNIKTNVGKSNGANKKLFGMAMIGFIVLIVMFLIYTFYKGYKDHQKYSPYLITGISDATIAQTFEAKKLKHASDSQWGTEFTYSFWIFVKDINFSSNNNSCDITELPMLHVFHKGSYDYIPDGSSTNEQDPRVYYPLLQMPGVWLYPNTNKLNIRFNTYENVVETSDVGNIPLNMWVHIIIVLIGSSVDVYVNGNLKKRTKLSGVPKINYGDFYTTNWGGFQGYLCRLRYFNYAIQPFMVDQLFQMGPSKEFDTDITQGVTDPSAQLSANYWMTTGYPNSFSAPGYVQNSDTTT
jgi:hypothetical protein